MGKPEYIDRAEVVTALNSRQLQARAGWVERELPRFIDVDKNHALLQTLGIDLDTIPRVDIALM